MAFASQEAAFAAVESELDLPLARVRLIRYRFDGPVDVTGASRGYRLDLCLLPRTPSGRAGFPERWGPHRFEPIGDLFLMTPGDQVRARGVCGEHLSLVCELEPDAVERWFDGELDGREAAVHGELDLPSAPLKAALLRLEREMRRPGFAGETLCELLAAQIAVDLARHCREAEVLRPVGGLAPWRLRLIDERLAEPDQPPTLAELAGACSLSVRQLTRGYRESRGVTIGDHIAESRVRHAKRLLADGALAKAVAHKLGFNSTSNFSAAFRRATGESPRQFRERIATSG